MSNDQGANWFERSRLIAHRSLLSVYFAVTRECVIACTDSAMRFCTPTLRINLATCALTVRSSMVSAEPISLFERPATSSSSTSFSRSVKTTRPAGKILPGDDVTRSMKIESTLRGAQTEPWFTMRIAVMNSSAWAVSSYSPLPPSLAEGCVVARPANMKVNGMSMADATLKWLRDEGFPTEPDRTTLLLQDGPGTVTDAGNSNPISGATVALGSRVTTTAANGTYSFTNLPAGTYPVITASAPGYNSSTATSIVVTDGGTTTQNFALTGASGSACLTDTTQADFLTGVPTNVDLNTSPGNVILLERSGERPPKP